MYAAERQELIEQLLSDDGRVSVQDLSDRFGVTTETVRRDLDALERAGALRRVHGGAVAHANHSTIEPTVTERSHRRTQAKAAIASRALEALGNGFRGSVFFDAGTTTAAVAELLPARLAATGGTAEVVTHSLSLAPGLAAADRVALTVVGGRVRGVTAAAVGAGTVRTIGGLRPDIVFVGTNGISAAFGLSTPDSEEAAVKEALVRAARRVVLVADAGKFGAESLVRFAGLDDIDVLVTDVAPTGTLAAALADAGTEVWVA
ncbi:DeoR/GlpR family DNA-binding transcription regulator [Microbacterium terrisoli]|jgi:DeoR family fructose operon transcriptional repressor|uniref:DeoR/GlpR family DNA-binding transcription regulator n=1 Tax=Microbacterium terrisoli TaxID=3242192 RepID=UPI00280583FD|nr:DeoR/GlpR family DNA-binding transcription regulator [Microbacterium protaetiae]